MMAFAGDLVAAFIGFAGAISLMAVGLLAGDRKLRKRCGDPRECQCGGSEFLVEPNTDARGSSR